MKKFLLFFLFFAITAKSQEISISFAASDTSLTINEVVATNLTTGTSIGLAEEDVLILQKLAVSVHEEKFNSNVRVMPNPINNTGILSFTINSSQDVTILLTDILGRVLAKSTMFIEAGECQYEISTAEKGMFVASIIKESGNSSVKFMQNTGGQNSLRYAGSSPQSSFNLKSSQVEKNLSYSPGDIISYECTSGRYIARVDETPVASKTINFDFMDYECGDQSIIYSQSEVTFSTEISNPEGYTVSYEWQFPEGTTGSDLEANGVSVVGSPGVIFRAVGTQYITMFVTINGEKQDTIRTAVNVNYDVPVKKLYYAVKNGNLMSHCLINDDTETIVNKSFDTGYSSGKHPLTMQFAGDWLYVFDAGSEFTYVADPNGLGDGEIFAISQDGEKRETVIENFGGSAYEDFYYGFVDKDNELIYWTDRREGIFRTSLYTRNKKFSLDNMDYFVRNDRLGYYGNGISWGFTNGPITKIGDTFWWAKNSTGSGVFRFVESDIKGYPVTPGDPIPQAGSLLTSFAIRGMAIDEVNGHIYVASQAHKMIFCFDLFAGEAGRIVDNAGVDDQEGGVGGNIFVSGMAISVAENGQGYLYWAYRSDGSIPSGIKRLKLNDPNAKAEYYIEGVEAYGVAVDNTLR